MSTGISYSPTRVYLGSGAFRPGFARSQSVLLVKSSTHQARPDRKPRLKRNIIVKNIAKAFVQWKPFSKRAVGVSCSEVITPSDTDATSHTPSHHPTFTESTSSTVSTPDDSDFPHHALELSFRFPYSATQSADSDNSVVKDDNDSFKQFDPFAFTKVHSIGSTDTLDTHVDELNLRLKALKEPEIPEVSFASFSAWEIPTLQITPSTPIDSVQPCSLSAVTPPTRPIPLPSFAPQDHISNKALVLKDTTSFVPRHAITLPNTCIDQWTLLWRLHVLNLSGRDLFRPVRYPWTGGCPTPSTTLSLIFAVLTILVLALFSHSYTLHFDGLVLH